MDLISYEELTSRLSYDHISGHFTWIWSRRSDRIGMQAGSKESRGYWQIFLNGKFYMAQRLAWFYVTRDWPPEDVDHINGDRSDNRIMNLRLASRSQNMANSSLRKDNRLGLKGVYSHRAGGFRAEIQHKKKRYNLGCHATLEAAKAAYDKAHTELFGEYSRT